MRRLSLVLALCASCREGAWSVRVDAPGAREALGTADGCTLSLDEVTLVVADRALVDEAGDAVARARAPWVAAVVPGGGRSPALPLPQGRLRAVWLEVGPLGPLSETEDPALAEGGLVVAGEARCAEAVTFRWALPGPRAQECLSATLDVLPGRELEVEVTLSPEALFARDLDAPVDAPLWLVPIVAADRDGDGAVTGVELAAVDAASAGYVASGPAAPRDLEAWMRRRSQAVATLPGGWCFASDRP